MPGYGERSHEPLAVGEAQQGKLTGCLHAFTVCTPSKDSDGGPHTPKLMIKHQGQHNVAAGEGEYGRGGVDGGRGYQGIWKRFCSDSISAGEWARFLSL